MRLDALLSQMYRKLPKLDRNENFSEKLMLSTVAVAWKNILIITYRLISLLAVSVCKMVHFPLTPLAACKFADISLGTDTKFENYIGIPLHII